MNTADFDRLNYLSIKLMNENISNEELKEFEVLLEAWNSSQQLSLIKSMNTKISNSVGT